MYTIDIELLGDKDLVKKLEKFRDKIEDWKPELKTIRDFFQPFLKNAIFETEGDVIGERWQQLSQPYKDQKRRKFSGRGILERSGTLRKGWKFRVTKNEMVMENKTSYGKYHQSTKPRKSNLPRRPILKIDKTREKYIVEVLEKGLLSKIRKIL